MTHGNDETKQPPLTYIINGEVEQTHAHELTVEVMLEQAGFVPVANYRLISIDPKKEYDAATDLVHLHEGQRFEALHRGPTPTS